MKSIGSIVVGLVLAACPVALHAQKPQKPAVPAAAPTTDAPKGNVTTGAQLYVKFGCYQCHGLAGQGGGAGPRLGPGPQPWPAFEGYVRLPTGQMPPYTTKIVTDQQLADIHAFVASLPGPSPAAKAMLRP